MEKLNITKGEWFSCCTTNRPHFTFAQEGTVTICGFYKEQDMSDDLSLEEVQANAILISDAGTTYNKTPILPSELLKQRDELIELLLSISEEDDEIVHSEIKKEITDLLTKTKNNE